MEQGGTSEQFCSKLEHFPFSPISPFPSSYTYCNPLNSYSLSLFCTFYSIGQCTRQRTLLISCREGSHGDTRRFCRLDRLSRLYAGVMQTSGPWLGNTGKMPVATQLARLRDSGRRLDVVIALFQMRKLL